MLREFNKTFQQEQRGFKIKAERISEKYFGEPTNENSFPRGSFNLATGACLELDEVAFMYLVGEIGETVYEQLCELPGIILDENAAVSCWADENEHTAKYPEAFSDLVGIRRPLLEKLGAIKRRQEEKEALPKKLWEQSQITFYEYLTSLST